MSYWNRNTNWKGDTLQTPHVLVVVSRGSTTHTELCVSPSVGITLGPAESGSVCFVDRLQRVWNNVLLLIFFST